MGVIELKRNEHLVYRRNSY